MFTTNPLQQKWTDINLQMWELINTGEKKLDFLCEYLRLHLQDREQPNRGNAYIFDVLTLNRVQKSSCASKTNEGRS